MGKQAIPLPVIHLHAAGIDVGSRSHVVAIDQNKENVRSFGVYTQDHEELILHLRQYGITTVAMESTGSYWQTLFNALQVGGFEVLLVGGSQTKNVQAGRPVPPENGCDRLYVDPEAPLAGFIIGQFSAERCPPGVAYLLLPSSTPN